MLLMPVASTDGQTTAVVSGVASAVGGISIDADGLLSNATVDQLGELGNLRRQAFQKVPDALKSVSDMREVSLKRVSAAIEECLKAKKPLPDSIRYLAGLQRIQYVFVYPEDKDIVLVGPGEGWKVDATGNVVGITTNRPVLLLDDLLVALRTAREAAKGGITCSIDPTPDGLARLQQIPIVRGADPKEMAAAYEKAMGMQMISLHGVPETSHFARVLVAADYRMKRIAMGFDPSPVRGLPSYLQMVRPSRTIASSPRFWLEPEFAALLCDADGLAFELGGSSVKAMTEADYIAATGAIQHSGKANPQAQRWADLMTQHYAELAVVDPIFGQLQNCMELAVVGAIVARNHLSEKAGGDFASLAGASSLRPDVFPTPKQTPSIASIKGRIVTVSGGVAINSWRFAEKVKVSENVASTRAKAAFADNSAWWRN
jgi:hypothetical protein